MRTKNSIRIIITIVVLLVPLVAMQFTDEVKWDLKDFIVIGSLLIGAGVMFELVASRVDKKYRFAIAAVFLVAVLLIWVELAVGIFG